MGKQIGKFKKPWEMTPGDFFEFAQKGRLHVYAGRTASRQIGSQTTALSLGESEGYSYEDIAFFYVACGMPPESKRTWPEATEKFGWISDNMDRIETAYCDFISDALLESKSVPSEILQEYLSFTEKRKSDILQISRSQLNSEK
jgi:hypothetical protein